MAECLECGRTVDREDLCIYCPSDKFKKESANKVCTVCDKRVESYTLRKFKAEKANRWRNHCVCWKCFDSFRNCPTLGEARASLAFASKVGTKSMGRIDNKKKSELIGRIGSLRIPVCDLSMYTMVTGFISSVPYKNFENDVVDLNTCLLIISRDSNGLPILKDGEVSSEWQKFKFRCREKTLINTLMELPTVKSMGHEVPCYIGKPVVFLFEDTKPPSKEGKVYWDSTPFFFDTPDEWVKCPSQHATQLLSSLVKDERFIETEIEFRKRNGFFRRDLLVYGGTVSHLPISLGYGIEKCYLDYLAYIQAQPGSDLPPPVGKKDDDIPF